MDPRMNELLKWGIQNSDSNNNNNTQATPTHHAPPDTEALSALFGGPSEADLMKEAMSAITSSNTPLADKLIAFDNFEQLVENMDNANNMTPLQLWEPLIDQMQSDEAELRRMAAWCLGTAVQNNIRAQEHILGLGALPHLVALALDDEDEKVRRKALYALSSAVRNCQPALNAMMESLPLDMRDSSGEVIPDATDMDKVNDLVGRLRERAQRKT
ncbi:MAG: hsp70 nucleotide exchange factor fes1 [Peltula sp. TS41687]|nr:MAG: hsp70 nucleotide exchange factor fes1 [Peltula sp. TS41687]